MIVDELLAQAHDYLDWVREGGVQLDNTDRTDQDIWFIQGALQSASGNQEDDPREHAIMCFAFAVHIAETLEATCQDVRMLVEHDGGAVREVMAVGSAVQNVLSWVVRCLDDPVADNIVFKYAGALRDFQELDRASTIYGYLEEIEAH
jgi:hypothetical protein